MILVAAGNRFRRDDGVGPRLLDRFPHQRCFHWPGDPLSLILSVEGHQEVIFVDAVFGESPGRIHRWTWDDLPEEVSQAVTSSHGTSITSTLQLLEAHRRLPSKFLFYAVEGSDYAWGEKLSPPVEAALETLERKIRAELER